MQLSESPHLAKRFSDISRKMNIFKGLSDGSQSSV